jgi:hypothetical protein
LKPEATVSGKTQAYVRDGVDLDAGSLKVSAGEAGVDRVDYLAEAISLALDFSFLAGGALIDARANVTGEVNAYVGATAGVSPGGNPLADINLTGALDIDAASNMDADARADSGGASAGFKVGVMRPRSNVAGTTRAYVGQGVDIGASGADVRADGDYNADATTISVQVAGLAAGTGAEADARITGLVDAHLGAGAGTAPSGDLAKLDVGAGQVNVNAVGKMTATPSISPASPRCSRRRRSTARCGPMSGRGSISTPADCR